jgi:hypothetical protein
MRSTAGYGQLRTVKVASGNDCSSASAAIPPCVVPVCNELVTCRSAVNRFERQLLDRANANFRPKAAPCDEARSRPPGPPPDNEDLAGAQHGAVCIDVGRYRMGPPSCQDSLGSRRLCFFNRRSFRSKFLANLGRSPPRRLQLLSVSLDSTHVHGFVGPSKGCDLGYSAIGIPHIGSHTARRSAHRPDSEPSRAGLQKDWQGQKRSSTSQQ